MQKFKYFFSCAVALAIAGFLPSCGDDEEPLPTLVPAMVTVAASDQVQDLLGDATNKDITVDANRELKITVPAEATWLTATVKSADLTTSKATLNIAVTDNTTAFKGRSATIQIECVASRNDDNVSGASAKATIAVTQSLKGLAVADVFDLKWQADGTPYDASANGIAIEVGACKPPVAASGIYGLPTVSIPKVEAKKYATTDYTGTDPVEAAIWARNRANYGDTYSSIADGTYWDHDGGWSITNGSGAARTLGDSKRVCYYKVQWGGKPASPSAGGGSVTANDNKPFVDAYNNAFSYEVLFRVPINIGSDPQSIDMGTRCYLLGNVNPEHCGFGLKLDGGKITFTTYSAFGGEGQMQVRENESGTGVTGGEAVTVEAGRVYHVVGTFSKSEGSAKLYVDGVLIASVVGNEAFKTHGIMFPTDYYGATNGQHAHDRRTWNTEWLSLGTGIHQSGMPTYSGPDMAEYAIARVYGKALTQAEVTASYNYFKPE